MIKRERLIKTLRAAIAVDSQNPPGNESRIANFTVRCLKSAGVKAKIINFKKDRSNVLAVIPGKNRRKKLLISPHLDTVSSGKSWLMDPFAGAQKDGKIYGLGATDCKCNLACALEAIKSLHESGIKPACDVIFAATADEECGSHAGLIPLLNKMILKPDEAVILDSDEFDIIVSQKGLLHLTVKIQGKRAHGAYPERGINAIAIAVDILKELKSADLGKTTDKYLKPPTLNIGTIKGGDKVNIVADWCEFEIDYRFTPGTKADKFTSLLKKICAKYSRNFKIEIDDMQRPYRIKSSHRLVSALTQAAKRFGQSAHVKGSEGATVITFFQKKNIPAVATGYGSAGCAHVADEYVKISNLYRGAQVLEDFLKNYKP